MQAIDGYIRVSRVGGREGDSFISPHVQRERIEAWAKANGYLIAQWHEDLDQSGGKMSRPGMDAMLARVEAGQTGGVVVAKLDRFGRSLIDALATIKRLDAVEAKFVSVVEQFDTKSPTGKLVLNIMLALAEFELERVREGWLTAQQRAVERGVHIASKVPTGYLKGEDGRLVPHQEYAPHVTKVFHMRAAGASWREIAAYLTENGVKSPYNGEYWRTRAASHMIANRVYLGEARSGQFVNKTAHEPLIDRVTWEAAQVAKGAPAKRSEEGTLLAGLVRCGGCRYAMKPNFQKLPDGRRTLNYRCRGEHAAGHCESRASVLGSVIEPYAEKLFFEAIGHMEFESTPATDEMGDLEAQLAEVERELDEYLSNTDLSGIVGKARFNAGAQTRIDKRDAIIARINEIRSALPASLATDLRELWDTGSVSERRKLLANVIDAIVVQNVNRRDTPIENRSFVFHVGELPDDWPRRGKRVALRPFDPDAPR